MPGKYCPDCGKPELVSDNQHRFTCEACQFEFFMNVAAAVGVILVLGEKVLVVKRGREPQKDKWDLPGGFVDQHETAEQALVRELHEELGLTTTTEFKYLGAWPNVYPYKNVTYHTLDNFFVATLSEAPAIHLDKNEVNACQWVPIKQLESLPFAFNSAARAIRTFCSGLPDTTE